MKGLDSQRYEPLERTFGFSAATTTLVRDFWKQFWRSGGYLNDDEWERAHELANAWNTCACGSLDDGIPRDHIGMPQDPRLQQLGYEFCRDVQHRRFHEAGKTWREIQKRSVTVLQQVQEMDHA